MNRGILTIAIGKKYISQAKFLAYSCIINSPKTIRAVITDRSNELINFYNIIIPFNSKDDPFSLKTRLIEFSPFDQTLFLDADSLLINDIDDYWNFFTDGNYLYEGAKLFTGKWYFDIKTVCKLFNLEWIPKFNSGMILYRKCKETQNIFQDAFYYFENGKNLGLDIEFFRKNHIPDEPALAISLSKHNIEPFDDFGKFSRTLIGAKNIKINSIKKVAKLFKNGKTLYPLVIHFCGRKGGLYYLLEKIRIFLHFFPTSLSTPPTPPSSPLL